MIAQEGRFRRPRRVAPRAYRPIWAIPDTTETPLGATPVCCAVCELVVPESEEVRACVARAPAHCEVQTVPRQEVSDDEDEHGGADEVTPVEPLTQGGRGRVRRFSLGGTLQRN